ncbi:MAG: 30S ribosomal protein S17 [Gemmataceae bacterium]
MAETTTETTTSTTATGRKRVLTGVVTAAKSAKTRRVEVARREQHPKYGKFVKKRTVCYVHDENNDSQLGDTVDIIESRPLSKTKRWTLQRIVIKAPTRTLSNLEGAVAGATPPAAATK